MVRLTHIARGTVRLTNRKPSRGTDEKTDHFDGRFGGHSRSCSVASHLRTGKWHTAVAGRNYHHRSSETVSQAGSPPPHYGGLNEELLRGDDLDSLNLSEGEKRSLLDQARLSHAAYFRGDVKSFASMLSNSGASILPIWNDGSGATTFKALTRLTHGSDIRAPGPFVRVVSADGRLSLPTPKSSGVEGSGYGVQNVDYSRLEPAEPPLSLNEKGVDAVEVVFPAVLRQALSDDQVDGEFGVVFARRRPTSQWVPVQLRFVHGPVEGPAPMMIPPLR